IAPEPRPKTRGGGSTTGSRTNPCRPDVQSVCDASRRRTRSASGTRSRADEDQSHPEVGRTPRDADADSIEATEERVTPRPFLHHVLEYVGARAWLRSSFVLKLRLGYGTCIPERSKIAIGNHEQALRVCHSGTLLLPKQ